MILSSTLITLLWLCYATAQDTFTIAGLFHDDNYQSEMAFKYAIARHNMFNHDIKFKTVIQRIDKNDIFATNKIVCDLVSAEEGIVAIFGPESGVVGPMVESIASNLEIPHLQTYMNYKNNVNSNTVLNIFPDPELLSTGLAALINNMNWKSYMIVYESIDGLMRLQDVLKIPDSSSSPVTIRQLGDSNDHRPLFKEIKKSAETNIILDCDNSIIIDVLKQAKEVDMLDYFHSYVITSLNADTLDFSILDTRANITTVRLFEPNSMNLHNAVRDWEMGELNEMKEIFSLSTSEVLAETALMHDAVNFFTLAFRELHITEPIVAKQLTCDGRVKWDAGYRIATYMKIRPMLGNTVTGTIKFNEVGKRSDFNLHFAEIISGRVEKIAVWGPENGPNALNFTRSVHEQMQQIVENLQKTVVIVSSRLGSPYLKRRQARFEGDILEGNAEFEGYSLDLIDAVAKELNFTYKFVLTSDGAYGSYDKKTKTWNGLIKDLLERKAHLAICDLTITHQRREAVDFSLPFMTLGVSILYSKSKPSERNIFAFMEPLDTYVWIYIVSAYISVTLIMYLIARMAPGDWENPHPCDPNPEELENIWTLKNCLWLILGSTMSQGCDILPKGISSRMATSMWWFFILIISSSYTANLAAFLTMDKMAPSIDSAESLAKQTKIKYGTVDGGSTQTFFKESNFSTFSRMWTQMISTKPSVFEKSNSEGVKRVLTTKNQLYAFLMESSSIEYEIERNCELKQVGNRLDSKGYGIAMPVNSPYRSAINKAVLKLQEDGTLSLLKTKWWKHMYGGGACDDVDDGSSSAELKLANVGGVFLVLGISVSIAMIFAIVEFLWNVHRVSVDLKISHGEAFLLELKFAVKVWITQKRTTPEISENCSQNGDNGIFNKKSTSLEYNSLSSFDNNLKKSKESGLNS
ncbi:PREDICTED: glutamate receptor ionotropic, kainate 2-like [Nicrophorus vespilloides]|uniref:Glutamate receptor ionotropic, kainate 2-like n=1 Tax=Nicrophorus vespilloides TaxID=110193 RepID=A0ABM1MH81_NICVS|nr:PREDICTED: glutamate receptor ionotropic, kainate 2-like [Nicrophorus vespilloides]